MPTLICCSAGRPALFIAQTFRTLVLSNVTLPLLLIVPHEEVPAYLAAVEAHKPPSMSVVVHGSAKGLTIQRQFARDMFPPTEHLVFIDDDVQRVRELRDGALHNITDFDAMAAEGFQRMIDASASLWGVYPVANRSWQSDKVQVDNIYCVGALYGIRNDIPRDDALVNDECEDTERELAIMAAGGHVVRLCRYGIQTVYYRSDSGGIQRTLERSTQIFRRIAATYPDRVAFTIKRNGQPNVRWLKPPVKRQGAGTT
jgi:hypothetical protein